jgi:hypothetical protein
MNYLKSLLIASLISVPAIAGSLLLEDFDHSFLVDGVALNDALNYEVKWGTVSGSVFTPLFGNAINDNNVGYYVGSSTGPEITVSLNQADNTVLTVGAPLALSFTLIADDGVYSSSADQIVLTDPSWTVPTFTLTSADIDTFTASTTVVGPGSFSFNGGNEIINIVAVPEPSTYAALAGVAVLGLAALRRRRA